MQHRSHRLRRTDAACEDLHPSALAVRTYHRSQRQSHHSRTACGCFQPSVEASRNRTQECVDDHLLHLLQKPLVAEGKRNRTCQDLDSFRIDGLQSRHGQISYVGDQCDAVLLPCCQRFHRVYHLGRLYHHRRSLSATSVHFVKIRRLCWDCSPCRQSRLVDNYVIWLIRITDEQVACTRVLDEHIRIYVAWENGYTA